MNENEIELPASLDRLVAGLDPNQRRDLRDVLIEVEIALGYRAAADRMGAPNPHDGPLAEEDRPAFYLSLGFSDGISHAHDVIHAIHRRIREADQ